MEAQLVAPYHIPYTTIPAAGVHGVGLLKLPGNLVKLARGWQSARRILREFKPDVLLFTGGYLAVPMALAARNYKRLVYVPDIEPGLALKVLAGLADVIALTTEESKKFFKPGKHMVVSGYPTRSNLVRKDRMEAIAYFQLDAALPVLLIVGGSKGAHSLNTAVLDHLPELLQKTQVIHLTGQGDWEDVKTAASTLSPEVQRRYRPFAYLHEDMNFAFSAADLAVSRAGASTLGEFPLFGLPAILVPYPYAWRYQKVNADYLVEHGAAVIVENSDLSTRILPLVSEILASRDRLESMKAGMTALSAPNAAGKLADLLLSLAAEERKR